jgi:hypothetical protein
LFIGISEDGNSKTFPAPKVAIGEAMISRIVSWVFILLICLALMAALFIVIGFLADQTGEASLVQNQLNLPVSYILHSLPVPIAGTILRFLKPNGMKPRMQLWVG